jgi:hypothetical protein
LLLLISLGIVAILAAEGHGAAVVYVCKLSVLPLACARHKLETGTQQISG